LVKLDANAVLGPPARDDIDEKSAIRDAEHFLLTVLGEGWVESKQVFKEAKDTGISERTLKRAKENLGVVSERAGIEGKRGGGKWYWRLPQEGGLECQPLPVKKLGTLNQPGTLNQNEHDVDKHSHQYDQEQLEFRHPMNEQIKDAKRIKSANPHTQGATAPLIPGDESAEAHSPIPSYKSGVQGQLPWDTFLDEAEER
jgi:hypothetical protein